VAFQATVVGAGVTTSNDGGIWVQGLDGTLRLAAREGSTLEQPHNRNFELYRRR
jgi:hypothetical protein